MVSTKAESSVTSVNIELIVWSHDRGPLSSLRGVLEYPGLSDQCTSQLRVRLAMYVTDVPGTASLGSLNSGSETEMIE